MKRKWDKITVNEQVNIHQSQTIITIICSRSSFSLVKVLAAKSTPNKLFYNLEISLGKDPVIRSGVNCGQLNGYIE